jgi:hypothetical protein
LLLAAGVVAVEKDFGHGGTPKMATVRIDGNVMSAAKNAAKKSDAIEHRDTDAPGLAIRVKSGTAFFWCVTERFKVSIAPVGYFTP